MDTSFNNTQNLAASGFDSEAVQNCRSLEQRLEVSEARTRCLLAALPQIVWLAEPKGAIAQFNQRWYEYTGLTEAESLGWEFLKALHPEDRDCFVACCHLASKKLQTYKIECRLLGLDGTYRWFIGSQTPVIGADGQLLEWVGTYLLKGQPEQYLAASWRERAEDYTLGRSPSQLRGELAPQLAVANQQPANLRVRKKAVNPTVKVAQQRLRNLSNELSHAIVWEADPTTEQFTFVSQSAEGLLGYPVEQWLSQPDFWVNIIHPEDRQWTVALSRKKMFQNRDYELEYRCLAADHRVVWLRDRACVVRDDQGRAHKRRGLMVDITLAKQAGEVLEARIAYQRTNDALYATTAQLAQTTTLLNKTIAALERRTQELDEFAYITSHDLKAPLRAIANLSQWLEDDIADQLHSENLRQMQLLRGRVYRLEALINGLLEYSRAGRLHSEPEGVEVAALLTQVIDKFAPPAQFTIEVAPGMPTLVTEHLPLEQVFAHLIGNAIKHHPSPDGTVTISVQDQSDAYEFAVADDGAGIAPQFQERVFGIFQTVKAKETLENIGVGLAIAKRIVESLGGSIRLESQEGRGSTFYFTWPK